MGRFSVTQFEHGCLCDGDHFRPYFIYTKPPEVEIRFEFSAGEDYYREIHRCDRCGHLVSLHQMNIDSLYSADYVTSNYKDLEGIKKTFDRINSLAPEKSDNVQRVARVNEFADTRSKQLNTPARGSVLDIGSGLGVFVYRMKASGWTATALDPDRRSAEHAKLNIGVESICADFVKDNVTGRYDLVTLNKVLEHVVDPLAMLSKAKDNLNKNGFVYVEVPDGEIAMRSGQEREEFTIDHLHIFSAASLEVLCERAGFNTIKQDRLVEPSGKFTLYAFLAKSDN